MKLMEEVEKYRAQESVLKQRLEQKQVTSKYLHMYTVHDTKHFTKSDKFCVNSHEFSVHSVNLLCTGNRNRGYHGYSTLLNTPLVSCSQTAILFWIRLYKAELEPWWSGYQRVFFEYSTMIPWQFCECL